MSAFVHTPALSTLVETDDIELFIHEGVLEEEDRNAFERPATAYDWMERALCAQVDPELFFPEHQGSKVCVTAKKICAQCDAQSQCLEQALRVPACDDFGVWGNTTPPEREEIRRQRRMNSIDLTGNSPVLVDDGVSF